MKSILERWIFFGIVIISFLCAWRASAKSQQVVIKKVFHHCAPDAKNLELGSCVLYGNDLTKDTVSEKTRLVDGVVEQTFAINRATISDAACKQMIQHVNRDTVPAGYQLKIDTRAPDTLLLTFRYPQERCMITYKAIDSIQREKGIVFTIYNRTLVHNLKKQQMPVIRTASIDSPPIIFIDPGHGGSDAGAIAVTGVTEKEVCLAISLALNNLLLERGYDVYLSRDDDRDVPLDMRTRRASECDATLVVSLHANSAPNINAAGSEIFFLDPLFVDDQQHMPPSLYTLVKKKVSARIAQSKRCAELVQHAFDAQLPAVHATYRNRGIKSAVSQLLLGAFRPTVLIEIGFLTNPYEMKLLADHRYQRLIATCIASGIDHYCRNI